MVHFRKTISQIKQLTIKWFRKMENNKLSWNWRPQCPKWVRIYLIWTKLWVERNGNVVLLFLTAVMACVAFLQYQSLEKQTKSLKNQAVSLEKQTKSIELQTIATQNNSANLPNLKCSYTDANDFIRITISNEGAGLLDLKSFEKTFCRIFYEGGPEDLSTCFTITNRDISYDETPGEISLAFKLFNFNDILASDKSEKISIVPFVVIKVFYKNQFSISKNKYFLIIGKRYHRQESVQEKPSKKNWRSSDVTGWSDAGWDSDWSDAGWDSGWSNFNYDHFGYIKYSTFALGEKARFDEG